MKNLSVLALLAATLAPGANVSAAASDAADAWRHPTPRPPLTPTLTAFTGPSGGINLNWQSVSNAEGFRVLRSSNGKDYSPIGEVTGTRNLSYTDASARPSGILFYRLEAFNAAGSSVSNTAVVRLPAYSDTSRPPAKRALNGQANRNSRKSGIPRVGDSTIKRPLRHR